MQPDRHDQPAANGGGTAYCYTTCPGPNGCECFDGDGNEKLTPASYDWRFQQMRQALVVIGRCEKCVGCSQTAREAIGGLHGLELYDGGSDARSTDDAQTVRRGVDQEARAGAARAVRTPSSVELPGVRGADEAATRLPLSDSAATVYPPTASQSWPIPYSYTCPNCGNMRAPGLVHHCPTLKRLSPLGGGPNPWAK